MPDITLDPVENDREHFRCEHTEHAIRIGLGRVGRRFVDSNDMNGTWESCKNGISK